MMTAQTTQQPGTISFVDYADGCRVKWDAADRQSGHDLAQISPYMNTGLWRVCAQDSGTGFQIVVGPAHRSLKAAQEWSLRFQDWPLLRQHIGCLPVRSYQADR